MTQPFVILNTEKTENSAGDIGGRVFGESETSGFKLDILIVNRNCFSSNIEPSNSGIKATIEDIAFKYQSHSVPYN